MLPIKIPHCVCVAAFDRRSTRLTILVLASLAATTAATAQPASIGNILTALSSIGSDTLAQAGQYNTASAGKTGLLTFELEDDFDAIQIGVETIQPNAWGLAQVSVAPSANYGPDPVIGSAAYDLDGARLGEMLPIQWSHGGANSSAPGNPVLALETTSVAPAGQSQLRFTSSSAAAAYGSAAPEPGWYVADGLGCITAGTTVTAVTADSILLSSPTAGSGCGAGQEIWFSPIAFGPFSQAISGSVQSEQLGLTLSDWIPITSLPRTDGGFVLGAPISGSGISAGTTISALTPTTIILSRPLSSPMPARAELQVEVSQQQSGDLAPGATVLNLANASGIRAGQTVSGYPAIPRLTHVTSVSGTTVGLDQATTDTIPDGTTVNFVSTAWTSLPAAAGATALTVPSTSARPLLHLRYMVGPGNVPTVHMPKCARNPILDTIPCEAPLGLPQVWSSLGPLNRNGSPVDGINFSGLLGGAAGQVIAVRAYPTFFVRFRARHQGATLLVCGGYQLAGTLGSVSGDAGPGRIAAAQASLAYPGYPVTVAQVANPRATTSMNFANCTTAMNTLGVSEVLLQDYSNHNGATVSEYLANVQAVAQQAIKLGIQPIIYLADTEDSATVGAVPVAADVVNSTSVPLATGISEQVLSVPTPITGAGIPPSTSTVPVNGAWSLQLSQPVTVSAGTVLHLGVQVASHSSNALTLTMPPFIALAGGRISPPGSSESYIVTLVKGSEVAPTKGAPAFPAGTFLRITKAWAGSNYQEAGQQVAQTVAPWAALQVNALGIVGTDPLNPYWLCDGCTEVGGYTNDYANSLIASSLAPILENLVGVPGIPLGSLK